jgi:Leucine-rich repeat (LRR) protein
MFVQSVADVDLQNLGSLEYLDLSRNLIKEILPGTFLGMQSLKGLDFSVNVVRKVNFLFFDNFNNFIFVRIRIQIYTLTNGSGSRSCYFRQ